MQLPLLHFQQLLPELIAFLGLVFERPSYGINIPVFDAKFLCFYSLVIQLLPKTVVLLCKKHNLALQVRS